MKDLPNPLEFIWDSGNIDKNVLKHGVSNAETEACFFDKAKVLYDDIFHSNKEDRYILLGRSKSKLLYVVFTIRSKKIRIISARNINKKEIPLYEKKA